MASADAMASSVQFSEARLSMERQRSTVCHRSADDVFAHRAHLVVVVGVFDQDVDLGEAEFDGETHTPGAVDDGESAVFFGHGRRLDDADDLDAGL